MKHHQSKLEKNSLTSTKQRKDKCEEKSVFSEEDFENLNEQWLKLY